MYTYKAKLLRVIDGDTVDAEIDLGFGVYMKQRVRMFGINTPDSRSKDTDEKEKGLASKQRLTELLTREFVIETILNKRSKCGRVLGILYIENADSKINVNEQMVADGFAVEYNLTAKDY